MTKNKRMIISVLVVVFLIVFTITFNKLTWSNVFLMSNTWIRTSVISIGVIALVFLNSKK